jgi:aminoglycoside phosphotransferase (APT) family kinase protein
MGSCETCQVVEELTGGVANVGAVMRDGDVVLRHAPPNVETIHALLEHLHSRGFPAPVPRGVTEDDREQLGYIPGETSAPPYPPAWVRSEETLVAVGRMLRSLHDSTGEFVSPPEASWSRDLADPAGGSVICHNDVCIENVVFLDGDPFGLLDFDFAAPGRPVWDLAMTARYWVPLLDPTSAAASNRQGLDPFARTRLLADAYGAHAGMRREFTNVLMEIEDVAIRFVMDKVEQGIPGFVQMWNDLGGEERHRRKMAWLTENLTRLADALDL